jgi:ergothioneine biosynthesis protein EgtB
MDDVSPTKWHLGHTTWFFETFILEEMQAGYRPWDPRYSFIFNSYYEAVGPRHPRPQRGLLSRPTVAEVRKYRADIDSHMLEFIETVDDSVWCKIQDRIVLGLHHEQQHQELLLSDIKHVFASNPLRPAYHAPPRPHPIDAKPLCWIDYPAQECQIGCSGPGFCFDNERPRHRSLTGAFQLANRLITNAEYLEFMADRGYQRPEFWLSDGWHIVLENGWSCPLYWENLDGQWFQTSLAGRHALALQEPVVHLSYYEADAFARWRGCRLPTEFEWELAAEPLPIAGNTAEQQVYHPMPVSSTAPSLQQMYGDVWEWTQSAYLPYPGFSPEPGAIGEYNGKFMCNQMVLRGGACVTSADHLRRSYRNFFYPHQRWQFAGIRLARNA